MSKSRSQMLSFLAGGGEMGERMRTFDWSATPLGAPNTWPQSLRSTVSMLLPSKAQIILFWGAEFTVLYNDAYRPVFGAKHPRVLGLPGREAWSEIWDTLLHDLLAGVVRTGEAFWARDLLFHLERYGFLEETYFDVSYDPVRVESGDVGGVFCIVTETTERVVGERRMALLKDLASRNATARTMREACQLASETLSASAQDVTFALTYLDGELQSMTPGALQRLSQAPAELVRTLPISSGAGGRPGQLVVGLSRERPFDDRYRAFLDLVADQMTTALGNARAYEEERKRAEALAEIDRAKTTFFSNVSHEFRTPLTLMLGPVEDLLHQDASELSASTRGQLEIVLRNSLRLLKLVNTMLDFSRIEAGRVQANFEEVDLPAYTAELASCFRSVCERAGLALTIDCPALAAGTAPAYVDRDMWEKIVLNLLSNAFKYTMDGEIVVHIRGTGDRIELAVRDTGIGIPPQELPRIFDRFHRVNEARGRTYEGTGIGLALVRELVKLHGGTVEAQSIQRQGSTFVVSIPLGSSHLDPAQIGGPRDSVATRISPNAFVEEAARWLPGANPSAGRTTSFESFPPSAADDAPRVRSDGEPRARILFADDNADMRDYVARLLQPRFDVTAVGDGLAALDEARRMCREGAPPDLVLSDVMMPGLDGIGLIRGLRGDPSLGAVPIVLLSARAGEESRIEGIEAGADDYVVKPFTARELLVRVEMQLRMAVLRRAVERALRERESERARAAEVLRESNQRKDEFLATLSHELRNPLAPIRTGLRLWQLTSTDEAQRARIVEMMQRQVTYMVRLIDDLLEVSRITRGKIELRPEPCELSELVTSALEIAAPHIDAARHRLTVRLPSDPVLLEADPVRIAQVIANLVNNAAKYTADAGDIWITARRDDGHVALSIRDSGAGIPAEMLPKVFDLFTQVDHTLGRSQGGLGIGLALVKGLVEMHGGTVQARSDGLGRGSEFIVRLPVARVIEPQAAGVPLKRPANTTMH